MCSFQNGEDPRSRGRPAARLLLLTSLLFGAAPGDRATLGAVAAFVTGLAVIAAWLPARRAARIDPAEALRS